jgi:hypothetical protein
MKNNNQQNHISKLARRVRGLNILKSNGFTEQNNFAQYQEKIKNNKLVQTAIHTKEMAQSAKRLRAYTQRNVWAQ